MGRHVLRRQGHLEGQRLQVGILPARRQTSSIQGRCAAQYQKYPEDETEKDLERHVASAMRGHWRNYLECVEQRTQPVANIEQAFISSAACILANLSQKLGGRTLTYDPKSNTVPGDREATALLRRPYRSPWVHPEPSKV